MNIQYKYYKGMHGMTKNDINYYIFQIKMIKSLPNESTIKIWFCEII